MTLYRDTMVGLIEESSRENHAIEEFEVTAKDAMWFNLRQLRAGRTEHILPPGKYLKLVKRSAYNDVVVMSDTPMERETNSEFLKIVSGDVLIAGLGIGLILIPTLENENVKSVTVLEYEGEVIDMVLPSILKQLTLEQCQKLTVVHADVYTYIPDSTFDTIYLDIWSFITSDNLDSMEELTKNYIGYLNDDGWIDCWSREMCIVLENPEVECWICGHSTSKCIVDPEHCTECCDCDQCDRCGKLKLNVCDECNNCYSCCECD